METLKNKNVQNMLQELSKVQTEIPKSVTIKQLAMDENYKKAQEVISRNDYTHLSTDNYPDIVTFDEWLEEMATM